MVNNVASQPKGRFRVLDLVVDLDRGTAHRGKQLIELPELSLPLLAVLISHAPNSVSKDDLIREVWGDVVVGHETLAQRVRLLRQALDEDSQSPRYIGSVRGRDYRLICAAKPTGEAATRRAGRSGLIGVALGLMAAVTFWILSEPRAVSFNRSRHS